MVDQMAMSLEEIIKYNNRKEASQGGGAGRKFHYKGTGESGYIHGPAKVPRGRYRGGVTKSKHISKGDVNGKWEHDLFNDFEDRHIDKFRHYLTSPAKLLISNLEYGVSDLDITQLFSDCGTLKHASVHYDRSGRSLGTANVLFERRADALKAMRQYNGVPLDGRNMKIHLATSDVNLTGETSHRGGGPPRNNPRRGGAFPRKQGGDRAGGGGAWRGGGWRGGRGGGGARGTRRGSTIEEFNACAWCSR